MRQPRAINADYFTQRHKAPAQEQPVIGMKDTDDSKDTPDDHQNPSAYGHEDAVADGELPPDLQKISDELRKKLANSPNHWHDPNFPKTGWTCTGATDLGAPEGICEMCNHQIIRYAHHLHHPASGRSLDCGCICVGGLRATQTRPTNGKPTSRTSSSAKSTSRKGSGRNLPVAMNISSSRITL